MKYAGFSFFLIALVMLIELVLLDGITDLSENYSPTMTYYDLIRAMTFTKMLGFIVAGMTVSDRKIKNKKNQVENN
jgi:predicted Kef-type K+ transport protein